VRFARHFVEWYGEGYTVELLRSFSPVTMLCPVWAVFRSSEFIGTLPYKADEPVEELEARCLSWLRDLIGTPLSLGAHNLQSAAVSRH
jgi:hypothetical protein